MDTSKPIFAYYIPAENLSRQRVDDYVNGINAYMKVEGLQCVIIPGDSHSKFECVWNPNLINTSSIQSSFIKELMNMIDSGIDSASIKVKLREYILDKILTD